MTELSYVKGVTSAVQTQLNAKANDNAVVHLAGTETITGAKTFSAALSGTSATFSGAINARSGGYLALYDISTNTNRWDIYTNSDNSFRLNYNGSGSDELTIASTGAATFSGFALINGYNSGLYNSNLGLSGNATYNPKLALPGYSGYTWTLRNNDIGGNGEFILRYEEGSRDVLTATRGGNVGIGASTNPQNLLEVSTAGGSPRIRVGTLQNNNNTARFEAITSSTVNTANSAWLRVTPGGGFVLGTSGYTKTGGDSGNFANLSAESETKTITVSAAQNVILSKGLMLEVQLEVDKVLLMDKLLLKL